MLSVDKSHYPHMTEKKERKRPSHNEIFSVRGRPNILFVTVGSKNRKPLFATPEAHQSLKRAWMEADHWLVGRYMILPDHIHFFSSPSQSPASSLRVWIKFWKRLVSLSDTFLSKKDLWLPDCWDTQIHNGQHYTDKWAYVRENPVRAALVTRSDEWPYQGELNTLSWR
ncbi:MAG: hypothetical protein LAT55_12935 [Opitutales bacterium]|nr:hypothetical protein [Opitutales bacterium]